MKPLYILAITAFYTPLTAFADPTPEQIEEITQRLCHKANQHGDRTLYYEVTKSDEPGKQISYRFYESKTANWSAGTALIKSDNQITDHMTFLFSREQEKESSLFIIDHQKKKWNSAKNLDNAATQVAHLYEAANKTLDPTYKEKERSKLQFHPYINGGLKKNDCTFGIKINQAEEKTYWSFLFDLKDPDKISKIEHKDGKTIFRYNDGAFSFTIDDQSGLLLSSTWKTQNSTMVNKLVKVEESAPPLENILPKKDGYHLDENLSIQETFLAGIQQLLNFHFGNNDKVFQKLLSDQKLAKAKLRKKFFQMLDFNEIDHTLFVDNLPNFQQMVEKYLDKQNFPGTPLKTALKHLSEDDKLRLSMANQLISETIGDKEVIDRMNNSLLGKCLNASPEYGEGAFLFSSTIRDALLEAYAELETYKAIDKWVTKKQHELTQKSADEAR